MELTLSQVGFIISLLVFGSGVAVYFYIENLKLKLRQTELDADMYKRLYLIERELE